MKEWVIILTRSAVLFLLVLILVRVMGKRQIARLSPFQFINYMIIALITALIATNIIQNMAAGLVALGVWVVLPITLDYLALKSKWVHDWVNGKSTVLIKDGKVMEEHLLQTRYSGEELLRELRAKNAFSLADVEFAVMETTGDINVLLKSDRQPLTPFYMGRKVSPQPEPQTVILDGNILTEPLANLGLNLDWLQVQLENLGISHENVFIGQADGSGELYVDLFNDALEVPKPKFKELLYANLQKSHADLLTFALETKDESVQVMYMKNAEKMKKVMEKMETYLLR